MLTGPATDCVGAEESVAFTVKVAVPAIVGVPVTEQLALIDKPLGREPEITAQVYGDVPPETTMLALYGTETVPLGRDDVPSESAGGAMVSVTVPEPLCAGLELSVALIVTVEVPADVGVPATAQFADKVNPVGSEPDRIAQVYWPVPPVTATVAEYGTPTVPLGRVEMVSDTGIGAAAITIVADVVALLPVES
jgi:hypothetical protein